MSFSPFRLRTTAKAINEEKMCFRMFIVIPFRPPPARAAVGEKKKNSGTYPLDSSHTQPRVPWKKPQTEYKTAEEYAPERGASLPTRRSVLKKLSRAFSVERRVCSYAKSVWPLNTCFRSRGTRAPTASTVIMSSLLRQDLLHGFVVPGLIHAFIITSARFRAVDALGLRCGLRATGAWRRGTRACRRCPSP